jgi:hypothetical protein
LYEEYRGFSHKGEHLRTNPNEKDLFILDQVGHSEVKAEISKFEKTSQLKVHGQLTKEEINEDNVVNFNRKSATRVAQHGLVIVGRQRHLGFSQSVSRSGNDNNSTPGSKKQIELDPCGTRPLVEGLNLDGTGNFVTSAFAYDSVAHEIAHGCSVWHHGDCDARWIEWRRGTNVNEVLESPGDIPVDVVPERGLIALLTFVVDAEGNSSVVEKYLGVPQGQHSGNATCIMRYAAATALKRDSSARRILLDPLNAPGRSLFCRSPQGTHYNAGPRNLFGSAHAGRGNCAGQICVNDLYIDSSVHNRDYPCEF